ncbi:DUF3592 domain-containing protein [bacterium]|nr:DUF3592 domain-containing protein [bacterium]
MIGKIIFVLIGLAMLAGSYAMFQQQARLDTFKETKCVITSSKVGVSISKKSGKKSKMFRPKILFKYEVDGKKFESDTYAISKTSTSSRKWPEGIVARYKENTEHPCYYDPQEPEDCVLNRDKSYMGSIISGIFGLLFIPIGLFGKVRFGKGRRRSGYHHVDGGPDYEVDVGEYDVDDDGDCDD